MDIWRVHDGINCLVIKIWFSETLGSNSPIGTEGQFQFWVISLSSFRLLALMVLAVRYLAYMVLHQRVEISFGKGFVIFMT